MGSPLRLAGALTVLAALLSSAPAFAGTNGTIGLAWDPPPPTDPHVDGWFLYWGATQGGPYPNKSPPILNDGTATPSYTMTGLTDCTMYYFVVTAFAYVAEDDAGAILESAFSNEAYGWPRPTLTALAPSTAAQQASFSMAVEGTNFNTTWGTPTVTFDDPAIVVGAVLVADCFHLSAPVDVNCSRTGAVEVTVTNPEGTLGRSGSLFSVTASGGCAPPDAGAPGPDAARPGLDAAQPPAPDAAQPPGPDAASPGRDAAAPGEDAASQPPGPDAGQPRDSGTAGDDAAADVDAGTVSPADAARPEDATLAADSGPAASDAGPPVASDGSAAVADSGFLPKTIEAGCGCSAGAHAGATALLAAALSLGVARRRRG